MRYTHKAPRGLELDLEKHPSRLPLALWSLLEA